jgi:hypothetical protein
MRGTKIESEVDICATNPSCFPPNILAYPCYIPSQFHRPGFDQSNNIISELIMPCIPLKMKRRFGGAHPLGLQAGKIV